MSAQSGRATGGWARTWSRSKRRIARTGCSSEPGQAEDEQQRGDVADQQVLAHVGDHELLGDVADRAEQGDRDRRQARAEADLAPERAPGGPSQASTIARCQ